MRPQLALVLALSPLLFGAPAYAQTRYGAPSPIPSALNWPGKITAPTLPTTPAGQAELASPAPLVVASLPSPAAAIRAAEPSVAPAAAPARPLPPVAPRTATPSTSAASPLAQDPRQALVGGPTDVSAPAARASAAPIPAPRPPAAQAVPQAAAPATTTARAGFAGYGVPQLAHYPGYDAGAPAPPAPATAPPARPATVAMAPAPQAAVGAAPTSALPPSPSNWPQARFYSVGREFGVQPDRIPAPTQNTGSGLGMTLAEPPLTGSLSGPDDTDYQPNATRNSTQH